MSQEGRISPFEKREKLSENYWFRIIQELEKNKRRNA
mgnify:FL=1|jgi:hypothetical protein